MALKTLSKTNIATGNTVQASDVSQSIDAFTGVDGYDITLSGSFILTGSLAINGLSQQAYTEVLVLNNSTGDVAYTASSAFGGGGGGVTINNNTNNYVLTATGTANTINGESNLLFDGNTLTLNGLTVGRGGAGAGSNSNSVLGYNALGKITGTANVAVGSTALSSSVAAYNNVAVGAETLRYNITGSDNIAIGDESGKWISGSVTTLTNPSQSIFIGGLAKPLADNETNEIVIGYDALGRGTNTVTIGNDSTTHNYVQGIPVVSGSNIGAWFVTGSAVVPPGTLAWSTPSNAYGASTTNVLGDPSAWLAIQVDGFTYKLPLYN